MSSTPRKPRGEMRPVSSATVMNMLADLPGQTDRVLMDRFGISYNTWRKVRAGEPIRGSVAARLEQRIGGASSASGGEAA